MMKPLCVLVPAAFLLCGLPAPAAGHSLEVGAGVHVPFDDEDRASFGAAPVLSIGYAAPLNPEKTWLTLEVAGIADSGDDVYPDDTFNHPGVEYKVLAVSLGVRTDAVPARSRGSVAFFLGIGAQTLFTRYENMDDTSEDAPSVGFYAELRPQLRISDPCSLWIRQRLNLVSDVSGNFGVINFSGTDLQVGLEFRPGGRSAPSP